MVSFKLFKAGYCKQCEKIARKSGDVKVAEFPMIVGLIEFGDEKVLFDTGYSRHFKECTGPLPEKLYDMLIPVTLDDDGDIANILLKNGIDPYSITKVVLSHFHADHISGVRLFDHAQVICSKAGMEDFYSRGRIASIREGYLHGLLPDNFKDKAHFFEDLERVNETLLAGFDNAFWLNKENEIAIVELPGHKKGHFGLYIKPLNTLFAADVCWRRETYIDLQMPSFIGLAVQEDKQAYVETIRLVHKLHHEQGVRIILCHCLDSYQDYLDEKA